jgi:hypothetical protein
MKKIDSFVINFVEGITRKNINLGNPYITLLFLLVPSVITILVFNLANGFLNSSSDFNYYVSQSTIMSSLMFIVFICIISLFNLISGNKVIRNVQLKFISENL